MVKIYIFDFQWCQYVKLNKDDISYKRKEKILLYTHQCSQSWYCCFHRVWSNAPDHHTVVFWIHITPLWNRWRSTQCFSQYKCMRYCDVIHIPPYKICTKYLIGFKMKHTIPTPSHKHIFMLHLEGFSTQDLAQVV